MKKTLKELGFKSNDKKGVTTWTKAYKGFILFVVKDDERELYLSSIAVNKVTVSLPHYIDDCWVCAFDFRNN